MTKRICYIHIGPHKTGTSSIQWFLKEKRAELLRHGYFVPDSRTSHGAHHPLAQKLCGQELPDHKQSGATDFVRQLNQSDSQAVLISSELLDQLLRNAEYARSFFSRLRELELEPKLVFFPRNQPQSINSRYAEGVRDFSVSEPIREFCAQSRSVPWVEILAPGRVGRYLQCYADRAAFHRRDNDAFAQRVWDRRPWNEIFGDDTGQEFAPNDFDIRRPDFFTRRRLRRAIRDMKAAAQEILKDPTLAVEDLRQRSG